VVPPLRSGFTAFMDFDFRSALLRAGAFFFILRSFETHCRASLI
jgi:hypothetical protein